MMSAAYEIIQHPTIGPIRGTKRQSGVVQFLGIQYATLKDRFARGVLREYNPKGDAMLHAIKHGPISLCPLNGCELDQKLIQKDLPHPEYPQSDTECLTLNIATPPVKDLRGLPVLVLIHGGAYMAGSSSYPHYDLSRITKQSVETGMPLIAVGTNYRLGAPGFLFSSAMKAAGYKPNNGLDDQRLAFRWIKHHIAGFGGDPNRVTCIGESAGGASACFHLHSAEPLFNQLIGMSGTSLLRPRPPQLLEESFQQVVEGLGVQSASPEEQIRTLLEISLDQLRDHAGPRIPLGPMVDGDIIPRATTYQELSEGEPERLFPGIAHCKRIIMGDCQSDSLVFVHQFATRTDILPKTLAQYLSNALNPVDSNLAPAIATAYAIDPSTTSNTTESMERVLDLGNDICFAEAARTFTRAWAGSSVPDTEALLYRFNCPNPWDGPWKGHALHIQDVAYLLLNYQKYLSTGQQQSAIRFANDIIAFSNGKRPWAAYQNHLAEKSMVYFSPMNGDKDCSTFVSDESFGETGRRRILQQVMSVGLLDKVMDAWQMFMAGP
ncbi:uncharacterized protein APUU_50192S [Aspergillus puulaauensis]|uniref:Carboxylesterase type B domain-containing protein n=1 Tax=Aspergillus puulaauensis TaxID=1220207 RepID=A0A7R8ANJ5_9EURO|nr:uncharacterized protein APUU_50192S [Aspergillus puulaauensis]BCS25481.1 hypothetical protein APUU_50192S [Aspergillus puulaauensis]